MLRKGRKTFLPIQGLCYTHSGDVKKSDRINSHSPGSLTGVCDEKQTGYTCTDWGNSETQAWEKIACVNFVNEFEASSYCKCYFGSYRDKVMRHTIDLMRFTEGEKRKWKLKTHLKYFASGAHLHPHCHFCTAKWLESWHPRSPPG